VCAWPVCTAEIVSTFDHPELTRLGKCDLIEEVLIGEDSLIRFSGVGAGEACTIVVRAGAGSCVPALRSSAFLF
jgi:T-complex protein 1 subunit beta